jgi:tetratricopeptide (TPR) repeat protein
MYADFLICYHRNAEWEVQARKALALDPMYFFWRAFYAWQLNYVDRNDEAIENLQNVLASNPNFTSAHLGLWVTYSTKGMDNEAFASAVRFFEALNDQETADALRAGFAARGYQEAMRRGGNVLAARAQHSHVPAVRVARLYAHAGENQLALTWLERAVDANETPIGHLAVARDWDALRSDPRFKALLRRLHLPE